MKSKNKPAMTSRERAWVERVKSAPCAVCRTPGPSEAHEIKQGSWYTSIALCQDCHRSQILGIHGQKRAWLIAKMDELDALNRTIEDICGA